MKITVSPLRNGDLEGVFQGEFNLSGIIRSGDRSKIRAGNKNVSTFFAGKQYPYIAAGAAEIHMVEGIKKLDSEFKQVSG